VTRKLLLALGAAAVLALIIGLVVAVRGDASGARSTADTPAVPAPAAAPAPAAPPRAPVAAPSQPVAVAPSPPAPVAPERQPGVPVVHDHRKDPPSGTPSPFLPETVAKVQQALFPAVKACASSAPAGVTAKASVTISVRSAGGRFSVAAADLSGAEALGEAYGTCVRTAAAAIQGDAATGQEDASQSILFPLSVP
jgi:hypothetical protein